MQRLSLLTLILLAMSIILSRPALARNEPGPALSSRVTDFTIWDAQCELLVEPTVTVDNDTGITYSNGAVYNGFAMADNPIVNGRSMIVVDSQTNNETDETTFWVTTYLYPEMIDGAFIAPGIQDPESGLVFHRGHGTRELAGLRIRFEADPTASDEFDAAELPCEPVFPPVKLTGVIIEVSQD